MKSILLAGAFLAITVGGCTTPTTPKPVEQSTVAPSGDMLADLRKDPEIASAGKIIAVLPDQPWINVADLDASKVKVNDVVTILDAQRTTLALGHVEAMPDSTAHIMYVGVSGHRPPQVGDIVVKFK